MKLAIVVEGDSDLVILKSQKDWFIRLGFDILPINGGGKKTIIREAQKHYNTSKHAGSDLIIFLIDQDNDDCNSIWISRFGNIANYSKVCIVIAKKELEAWELADGSAVSKATKYQYTPSGMTDSILNPKDKLNSLFQKTYGYALTPLEMAKAIAPYFDIEKASNNNVSVRWFVNKLKEIVTSDITSTDEQN